METVINLGKIEKITFLSMHFINLLIIGIIKFNIEFSSLVGQDNKEIFSTSLLDPQSSLVDKY